MANPQNLIAQAHKLTVEEQSKGGKASVEARKQKKLFRELFEELLNEDGGVVNGEPITRKQVLAIKTWKIMNEDDISPQMYFRGLEFLRDTCGEKPMEKVAMTVSDDRDALDEILEQLGTVENAKPKG